MKSKAERKQAVMAFGPDSHVELHKSRAEKKCCIPARFCKACVGLLHSLSVD